MTLIQGQGSYQSIIAHNYREIAFNDPSPTRVLVSTAFYPTWKMHFRGAAREVTALPNAGMIEARSPQGSGRLSFTKQKATALMIAARAISALTILDTCLHVARWPTHWASSAQSTLNVMTRGGVGRGRSRLSKSN